MTMSILGIFIALYFGIICGIELAKSDESVTELKEKFANRDNVLFINSDILKVDIKENTMTVHLLEGLR